MAVAYWRWSWIIFDLPCSGWQSSRNRSIKKPRLTFCSRFFIKKRYKNWGKITPLQLRAGAECTRQAHDRREIQLATPHLDSSPLAFNNRSCNSMSSALIRAYQMAGLWDDIPWCVMPDVSSQPPVVSCKKELDCQEHATWPMLSLVSFEFSLECTWVSLRKKLCMSACVSIRQHASAECQEAFRSI
jgi:hypothetical protein